MSSSGLLACAQILTTTHTGTNLLHHQKLTVPPQCTVLSVVAVCILLFLIGYFIIYISNVIPFLGFLSISPLFPPPPP